MAFTIAKNGFYIPVFDTYGKLLFTIEDYQKIRNQMDGLSYYGVYDYNFSPNLDFDGIEQIISNHKKNNEETKTKIEVIKTTISDALTQFGLEMKDHFDGDLSRNKYFFIDILTVLIFFACTNFVNKQFSNSFYCFLGSRRE